MIFIQSQNKIVCFSNSCDKMQKACLRYLVFELTLMHSGEIDRKFMPGTRALKQAIGIHRPTIA